MTKDYRVFFVQKKGEQPLPLRELRLFFRGFPAVLEQIAPRNAEELPLVTFTFENEAACTFFSFEFSPEIHRSVPDDFADSGLTLVIELARPPFFASSAIDVAIQLAVKFNLLFLLPGSREPVLPDKKHLIARYEEENIKTVERARKKGEIIPFLPRERLLYWFNYTSNLAGIQKKFDSTPLTVPPLRILQYKNTSKAITAFPWVRARPTLFPQADYVIVERAWHPPARISSSRAPLPRRREKVEVGLAPFAEVVELVSSYTKSYKEPVPFLIYRVPAATEERTTVRQSIIRLPLFDLRAYKVIRPDSVVDFPPQ